MFSKFRPGKKKRNPSDPSPDIVVSNLPIRSGSERRTSDGTIGTLHPERIPRHGSVLSTFQHLPQGTSGHASIQSRSRSQDRRSDPLGLRVLFVPENAPTVDVVFVHGLGGTSRYTWAKHRNLELFWPLEWLPSEVDISTGRIFSFGYNARFMSTGASGVANILDFSKSLLYDMRYGSYENGELFAFGNRPVIFITHSMGGLVFKQAYLQAKHDQEYAHLAKAIQAVIFLSTPHRGSNLAPILNKILDISLVHSTKQYISDLAKNAPFLEQINEQFRQFAPKLQIFSFYETIPTPVGPKSMMIVEKDSSILGYPGERSRPLEADHHGVCKFESREDPNYISVRWALRSLVCTLRDLENSADESVIVSDFKKIKSLLSAHNSPERDLQFFSDRRADGTCDWILKQPELLSWMASPLTSAILWLHARPASGKSVISAYVINYLRNSGAVCQYFFFRFGDHAKQTPGSLLLSLAYQIAQDVPMFRIALATMGSSGNELRRSDWRNIWKRVFVAALFNLELSSPLFWVIDGLDESEASLEILEMLASVSQSKVPIRVLLTSRKDPRISSMLNQIGTSFQTESLSADETSSDISIYAEDQLKYIWWSAAVKDEVVKSVVQQANGNFLWVYLVLEAVKTCHTEEAVEGALKRLPVGMNPLYRRMEENIALNSDETTKALAYQLLNWTIYSRTPISIAELSQILGTGFGSFLDIRKTVSQLCGHFVVIDGGDRLSLVHQTAREYLMQSSTLPFSLDASEAHRNLFEKSLFVFMDSRLRTRFHQNPEGIPLEYRATSWAYHLNRCSAPADLDKALTTLTGFLRQSSVLQWIQAVASLGKLQVLAEASRRITSYLQRKRALDSTRMPLLHRLDDIDLLERWSRDLLKIVGKFGAHLLQNPSALYNSVAPFCPQSSAIYKLFGKQSNQPHRITVTPLPDDWDDCLARFHVPGQQVQASVIRSSGRYIAVLTSHETIILWDSMTFEELRRLSHGEHVYCISFNTRGDWIASYGRHTTNIWSLASGRLVNKINNIADGRALTVGFSKDDNELFTATDFREVLRANLTCDPCTWKRLDGSLLREVNTIEGTKVNSPSSIVFNRDRSVLSVAYRMFPLTVWSLNPPTVIRRCKRTLSHDGKIKASWTGVRDMVWHPNDEEVLGVFVDGCIFKWNPYEDNLSELSADVAGIASQIDVSPDGLVFATSDRGGAIRLFDFSSFSLLYKLSSEDIVTGLSFSPDGRRFYDLRGSYCNIWEPNVLIRITAIDEQISESQSEAGSLAQSHQASEAFADNATPIKALSPRPHSDIVCIGNDDGYVELYDHETGQYKEIVKSIADLNVEHLTWSGDGGQFVYAELGSRIKIFRLAGMENPSKDEIGVTATSFAAIKPTMDTGGITELILNNDGSLLLVVFRMSAQLWSTQQKQLLVSSSSLYPPPQKWTIIPSQPQILLSATTASITVHNWHDLKALRTLNLHVEDASEWDFDTESKYQNPRKDSKGLLLSPPVIENLVSQVLCTHSGSHFIYCVGEFSSTYALRHRLYIFDIASLAGNNAARTTIEPIHIPLEVLKAVDKPLNIIGRDRLVFLDRSFWVCTYNLDSTTAGVTRHFFLPRDWVDPESLDLLKVLSDGTLLYPRKGKVAVIRSAIASGW